MNGESKSPGLVGSDRVAWATESRGWHSMCGVSSATHLEHIASQSDMTL